MRFQTRIIASASMALILTSGFLWAATEFIWQKRQVHFEVRLTEAKKSLWNKTVSAAIHNLKKQSLAITRDRSTIAAIEEGKIENLQESAKPTFNRLSSGQNKILDRIIILDKSQQIILTISDDSTPLLNHDIMVSALESQSLQSGFVRSKKGHYSVGVAFPLYSQGKLLGSVLFAQNVDVILSGLKDAFGSDIFITDLKGQLVHSTNKKLQARVNFSELVTQDVISNDVAFDERYYDIYGFHIQDLLKNIGSVFIASDVTQDYMTQRYEKLYFILAIIVISFVFVGGQSIFLSKQFKRLNLSVKNINLLANGDMSIDTDFKDKKDEIGELNRAILVFKENYLARQKLEIRQKDFIMEGQTRQMQIDELIARFRSNVQKLLCGVGNNIESMEGAANELLNLSDSASRQVSKVMSASDLTSKNVHTIASSAQQLSSSISDIGGQVAETTTIIGKAATVARSTSNNVNELAGAVQRIGDIIGLIQDIAENTNLLALNATIESARAGEMGRGFAVVASEVKELSTQTSKATDEISMQIMNIQSSTNETVTMIEDIAEIMEQVNEFATNIAQAVKQQDYATNEMSNNIQEAASGVEEVSENVSGVTNAVSNTTDSAHKVSQISHGVAEQTEQLKHVIDAFLEEVAAA